MSRRTSRLAALVLASTASAGTAAAAEHSYPLDCLPDRVVAWEAVAANPETLFGALFLPGVVLGPPGNSLAFQGSLSVAALGFGGRVVLAFESIVIENGPGPDFIVFENPFFRLPLPATGDDDFRIFAEPAVVEVSADGTAWFAFPFDAQALEDTAGQDLDPAGFEALSGLAGLTPTLTGNWTVPDDPLVFDPGGTAGVSGAGGDAFDLATVGLAEARFIRITDAETHNGFPGAAEGFDLDAVVAIHARPAATTSLDADGDGLPDAAESGMYGSNPALADSDGDGVDDGREVARCRDPASSATTPTFHGEPRLWLRGAPCTELRWSFAGSGLLYDVVRGDLASVWAPGGVVDLGPMVCLEDNEFGLRWSCDGGAPASGEAFFYLVRTDGASHYGRSSAFESRSAGGGCP